MLIRALIACLLAATLWGCAAGPTFRAPATGTVTGHVQVRACGGAYRPEQTGCPTRPMTSATLSFQLTDSPSASTTTTDSAGAYRIDLKPGTYSVQVTGNGPDKRGFAGFAGPRKVTVAGGKSVTADFVYTIQLL